MTGRKLKIGVASALAGVSLAGSLLLGAPWVSAQTPPTQPTPQRQQQPGAPGQLQPDQRGGQESDHDCPRDENGNMLPRGGNTPGGTSYGSGARVLHQ